VDFLRISFRASKRGEDGSYVVHPIFVVKKSKDLMIRGGDFYAVWDERKGLWSKDQDDAITMIDDAMDEYKNKFTDSDRMVSLYLSNGDTKMIDKWHHYCQKQMQDNYHNLDEKLVFANSPVNKEDYASKRLPYALAEGDHHAWDELVGTLYSPPEKHKIEWAIGSIVSGDSKNIQKFLVFYGAAGTGKSTILNIIQELFDGYYCTFSAKALGSTTDAFALEPFKNNPLVAIQHDGDLSRIEDNTRLNSLVSHEEMTVNEKFKSQYTNRFNAMLFMGTNKPVKITDSKSGIIRRLIDISPTEEKIPFKRYKQLMKEIGFELGAIAWHCLQVYQEDPDAYDHYLPKVMIGATNDFYNFMEDNLFDFKKEDGITLQQAWARYNEYVQEAKVPYPYSKRVFKEELKDYFREFKDRTRDAEGRQVCNYYTGLKLSKFGIEEDKHVQSEELAKSRSWLELTSDTSAFDVAFAEARAQYGVGDGEIPEKRWDSVRTCLKDLDTSRLHYVRIPEHHIVIDFDLKDEEGNKSRERNLEAAAGWPPTYAEFSKSGAGLHLHYDYNGDPSKLSRVYAPGIEIKVFTGKSSLRRKLNGCNNLGFTTIGSGLPLKEEKTTVSEKTIKDEQHLEKLIKKALRKEIEPYATKPCVDFIFKILTDAYEDPNMHYDLTALRPAVMAFAASSSHHAQDCLKLVSRMPFKSEEPGEAVEASSDKLIFFDCEVFPNLLLVNWKFEGEGIPVARMINPTPNDIEALLAHRLVGFNCRRYDNHILYARLKGWDNEQIFTLSNRLINGSQNAYFGEAYDLSYTDVYDFCSKKQSLKKWEIELGIHHQELGLPWDQPVPEELWCKVAEYCDNDVIATEAVFNARHEDFVAREILADISGLNVNATTNQHTTRIIFGANKKPQSQFVYTDLSEMFPGYKFDHGTSTYRGEVTGEGGYVYSEPGMYENVALLDIASMHPTSIECLNLFGPYTKNFSDIKLARIRIKHGEFEEAGEMFGGKLAKYLGSSEQADALAYALKIAINSVYGLTSANFENPFRDPRNKDNIVAKRGALFMINLKHEVQEKGFTVAHIKTDSIKIPDATPEIIQFVMDYGKQYGYTFEHEATYSKMCLVNDAVYIAKYDDADSCQEKYGYIPSDIRKHPGEWTATGTQFQVPYVFKTLFSKEPIEFADLCETKTVTTALYLDMNEDLPDVSDIEKSLEKLEKKVDPDGSRPFDYEEVKAEYLAEIAKGHDYKFVGKAGSFCPIKKGCGGGLLVREKNGKFSSAAGCKGYRWLESETVKVLGKEQDIDLRYYAAMVDDAIASISEYGDFEAFAS